MATIEDVRALAATLPRSDEVLVRDRVKFRVGAIVWLAFSRDEQVMGFAFDKEERAALVASDPAKFSLPSAGDMRFNWVHAQLAALGPDELHDLVLDAWQMVVPKFLGRERLAQEGLRPARPHPAVPIDPPTGSSRTAGPSA
jgi:hypothetical protein